MSELDRRCYRHIVELIGEDEQLARAVRMALEERFGWSLAYFDQAELRYRWASEHRYDEADEVPDELWLQVWPILSGSGFWRDAAWLDEFAGDRISYWIQHEERCMEPSLRERIAAWEVK